MRTRYRLLPGVLNRCPACRRALRIKRPAAAIMMPCPRCGRQLCCRGDSGNLVGFRFDRPGTRFFDLHELANSYEDLVETVARVSKLNTEQVRAGITLKDLARVTDSLDLVELIMDLEEEINAGSGVPPSGSPLNFA